jgi:hypothetical protein
MSYTVKNIYTRPNESVTINFVQSDLLTLIDSFYDQGKILQKPVKTVSGLTETYTTIFKDEASYVEFKGSDASHNNWVNRNNFCSANLVSWSIETP